MPLFFLAQFLFSKFLLAASAAKVAHAVCCLLVTVAVVAGASPRFVET